MHDGRERTAEIAPSSGRDAGSSGAGVGRVHIIDGREEHSLLLELFTDEGIGTMIHRDDDRP